MTREEESRLFVAHVRKAGDLWCDVWAQLAAFERHAKSRGRTFNFFRNHGAM